MISHRHTLSAKTALVALVALAAGAATSTSTAEARAEDSSYCKKVQARADADAALLFAPSVQAQAIKFPASGTIDAGVTNSRTEYQVRGGLAWSPLDFYKGFRVLEVANADCAQADVGVTAQEVLRRTGDIVHLAARREQLAYLEAQRPHWEAVITSVRERFDAKNATAVDVDDVRTQASTLARLKAQAAGDIARWEAEGAPPRHVSIPQLIRQFHDKSMRYEREVSHVRSLDAWHVSVTGGYVPSLYSGVGSDVFGIVQVGYNLGGPVRTSAEGRYLRARDQELADARTSLAHQLEVLQRQVRAGRTQAEAELAIVEERHGELEERRRTFAQSDSGSAPQALARIELAIIAAEAERIYLTGLIREFGRLEAE